MADYVTLVGAEQVSSAAYVMRTAADGMRSAASSIDDSLRTHARVIDDALIRLNDMLERFEKLVTK